MSMIVGKLKKEIIVVIFSIAPKQRFKCKELARVMD
jgi:hypothetical protein